MGGVSGQFGLDFNEHDRLFLLRLYAFHTTFDAVWRNNTLPEKLNYKFRLHTGQMEIVDYMVDQKTGSAAGQTYTI